MDAVQVKPRSQRGTRYSNKDGHVPDTTPPPADGDTNTEQDNWEGRYSGLQRVLAKRDTELTTATTELGRLQAEHEQAIADLATYRQRDVDTSEEDLARQQFEQLRERFEPEPVKPIGNNPARDWTEGSGSRYAERPRTGTSHGWPI
jgi:hypothetical protein